MRPFRVVLSRVRALFSGRRREAELNDEIQTHLDLLAQDHADSGLSEGEARAAARRAFGGVEQAKEQYRDQRGFAFIDSARQDVRYGLRQLRRSPGFTIAVLLSLGLGIGANTAIFTLINALVLTPLPVRAAEELRVFQVASLEGSDESFSYPLFQDFSARTDVFAAICATGGTPRLRMTVNRPNGTAMPDFVSTQRVSGNFFDVLGVAAALGRTLTAEDDRPGDPRSVAVISYRVWVNRFGKSSDVLGQSIALTDIPVTIVGVAPAGFRGVEVSADPDLWVPLNLGSDANERSNRGRGWLLLTGRLRRGVSEARAREEMDAIFRADRSERIRQQATRLDATQHQSFLQGSLRLVHGGAGWTRLRKQFLRPLYVLMLITAFVLLIAIANVANLVLARAAARRSEMNMRLALGAARRRLMRQLLTESVVLAALGGALGYVLARWGIQILLPYVPSLTTRVVPDASILAFTLGSTLAAGLLFGLAPAFRAARSDLTSGFTRGSAQHVLGTKLRLSYVLVASQVALSVFLLIGAGLFTRSLQNLVALDLGFDRSDVTVFQLDMPSAYDATQRTRLYERVLERVAALPGVRSASYSVYGLLSGSNSSQRITMVGLSPQTDGDTTASVVIVGPKFFETMGTPVILGRGIAEADRRDQTRIAVINAEMARRFFPVNPIGRRFSVGTQPPMEIVGVVGDAKYRALRETAVPTFYVPASQMADRAVFNVDVRIEVRTSAGQGVLPGTLRRAAQQVDPGILVADLTTMDEVVTDSVIQDHLLADTARWFGALALVLAAIGVYGVRSYGISRRTSEIGIRMALGANRRDVFWSALRGSLGLVVAGGATGVVLAMAAARTVRTLLFGLQPDDPFTMLSAVVVMGVVAVIASCIPAYRASALQPMAALRHE